MNSRLNGVRRQRAALIIVPLWHFRTYMYVNTNPVFIRTYLAYKKRDSRDALIVTYQQENWGTQCVPDNAISEYNYSNVSPYFELHYEHTFLNSDLYARTASASDWPILAQSDARTCYIMSLSNTDHRCVSCLCEC